MNILLILFLLMFIALLNMSINEVKKDKKNEKKFHITAKQMHILKQYKVEQPIITAIASNEEADEFIKYLRENKDKNEDPKEKFLKLKANMGGHKTDRLPDAEDIDVVNHKLSLLEKMKPMSVKHAFNNRRNTASRVQVIFSEEYPEGRYF